MFAGFFLTARPFSAACPLCLRPTASTPTNFAPYPLPPRCSVLLSCSTGQPLALDFFYQQRGQQLQHMLRQVSGDQRLMTPTTLAENSPSCPRSAEGDMVLPSGNPWCRQLLMLLFTSKILGDAAITLKPSEWRGQVAGGGGLRKTTRDRLHSPVRTHSVAEAVVVLAPLLRCKQGVQRGRAICPGSAFERCSISIGPTWRVPSPLCCFDLLYR
jgi:hypothetical protein